VARRRLMGSAEIRILIHFAAALGSDSNKRALMVRCRKYLTAHAEWPLYMPSRRSATENIRADAGWFWALSVGGR